MSSVTSSITAAPANGLYAATKGGVNALTKAAAIEVGKDNISVTRYRYRGARIPTPWTIESTAAPGDPHARRAGQQEQLTIERVQQALA